MLPTRNRLCSFFLRAIHLFCSSFALWGVWAWLGMCSSSLQAAPISLPTEVVKSASTPNQSMNTASLQTQDLAAVYRLAQGYDASYQASRAQYQQLLEQIEQVRANILPAVDLTLTGTRSSVTRDIPASTTDFGANTARINVTQPVFNRSAFLAIEGMEKQTKQADAQLQAAEQDLIVRVSQAYFDVLVSQETLSVVQTQKTALTEQLRSIKAQFDVGMATTTDVQDVQARHDLVIAQEISSQNELNTKQLVLQTLVGKPVIPQPLSQIVDTNRLAVAPLKDWLDIAQKTHPNIVQTQMIHQLALLGVGQAKAGYLPTLSVGASYTNTLNINGNAAALMPSSTFRTENTTLGLTMNWSLFSGFSSLHGVKAAQAQLDQTQALQESAVRTVIQNTQTSYITLLTAKSLIQAYETAVLSAQAALDANKLGRDVGVRVNLDVLNAQTQYYQNQKDLTQARYNYLMSWVRLGQASGELSTQSLDQLRNLMATISN
jgi:outer membrane protein